MMKSTSQVIPDLPFCLGAMATPQNPGGLPNTYPFQLELNYALGRLEQSVDPSLDDLLERAYRVGNEMGTPSDNTELGRPYVDDFMRFIDQSAPCRGTLLEIGAGTGFLSKCLAQVGWHVTSIEPGMGYQRHWESHGVEVVNDFFPSQQVTGQFDAIVFYTVLEHLKDTKAFLDNVKKQLKPEGRIFLAVPDCTIEISARDPSILLHEHLHYFTAASLTNTLAEAGFAAMVETGKFGRSLFSVGSLAASKPKLNVSHECVLDLEAYITSIPEARATLHEALERWLEVGEVGMYCPSRLLNFIPVKDGLLFYDDAVGIQGRYYPPFAIPVRNRTTLFADSPPTLLIGSRTFGARLKADLFEAGLRSKIVLLSDLL
jgi:SAM-dependent methyltransferase